MSVPVLALLAGRSVLLNAAAAQARLQSLIPGVQAVVITKAGHGLTLEHPDLINQRVLRFLDARTSATERRPG